MTPSPLQGNCRGFLKISFEEKRGIRQEVKEYEYTEVYAEIH